MVNTLISRSSGPGSSANQNIVLSDKILYSNSACLKWVPADLMLWDNPIWVEILLTSSYYRNQDKLRSDGPMSCMQTWLLNLITLVLFYKNKFYKTIQAEICKILRLFYEKKNRGWDFQKNVISCWKFVNMIQSILEFLKNSFSLKSAEKKEYSAWLEKTQNKTIFSYKKSVVQDNSIYM